MEKNNQEYNDIQKYLDRIRKLGSDDGIIRSSDTNDLRSSFCTLLLKSDFNPKAVSKLMGHAKELITVDVYGDNQNIIPEEIPELTSYIDDVLPKKTDEYSMELEVLDTVMEVEQYLQQIDAEE